MPYRSLMYACYYGYFCIGLVLTVIGPIIPAMRESYALSLSQISPIFLFQGAGFSLAVLASGFLADKIGRRPVLLIGASIMAFGFLAFAVTPGWSTTLFLIFITWAGFGITEGAINSLAVDLSDGNAGKSLNTLHFFPALGAVLAPFGGSYLLSRYSWQAPLVILGFLYAVFLLWLFASSFPPFVRSEQKEKGYVIHLVKNPVFLAGAIALSLYVGAENAVSGWSVTYLLSTLASSPVLGALVTSLFWLGLMVGRALCGRWADGVGYLRLVFWISLGTTMAYIPVIFTHAPIVAASFTFFTGMFMGGIFPTMVAHASQLFPQHVGSVMGLMIASCSIGGAAAPALIGTMSDRYGMRLGLFLIVLASAGMTISTAFASYADRRTRPAEIKERYLA